jgi:FkbM family methyltransferase
MHAAFPWGDVEFTDHGAICQQVEAIFFEKIYEFRFQGEPGKPPKIIDCGSNIGLSAIWFKQNYPGCELACYEADFRLAAIAKGNLEKAGFSGDHIVNAAVWTEGGKIGFQATGDDKGTISTDAEIQIDCIDLSQAIGGGIDLLKMDIEGAEFPVLLHLFETGAISKVHRLAVEFHDVDQNIQAFADVLTRLVNLGYRVRFRGGNLPWLGKTSRPASSFSVVAKGPIYLDLFAEKRDLAEFDPAPARIADFPSARSKFFPLGVLNPLKPYSWNFRAARVCQYHLSRKNLQYVKKPTSADFTYATLVSKDDLILNRVSIASFLRCHADWPVFALGLDGSATKEEVERELSGLPIEREFYGVNDVAQWHENTGHFALSRFCREHVFGFKLGLNLMLAKKKRVFYADADVLWFAPIQTELERCCECSIYASVDLAVSSLDFKLAEIVLRELGMDSLQPPFGCAGISLFNMGFEETVKLVDCLCEIILAKVEINRLTEQTIVALLAARSGSFLDAGAICMVDEMTNGLPSWRRKNWVARHYAGPWRSQFWIDAFWFLGGHFEAKL